MLNKATTQPTAVSVGGQFKLDLNKLPPTWNADINGNFTWNWSAEQLNNFVIPDEGATPQDANANETRTVDNNKVKDIFATVTLTSYASLNMIDGANGLAHDGSADGSVDCNNLTLLVN
jgi:hypothetical protein